MVRPLRSEIESMKWWQNNTLHADNGSLFCDKGSIEHPFSFICFILYITSNDKIALSLYRTLKKSCLKCNNYLYTCIHGISFCTMVLSTTLYTALAIQYMCTIRISNTNFPIFWCSYSDEKERSYFHHTTDTYTVNSTTYAPAMCLFFF